MLLAIAGILMIMGLLGFAAFMVGREHLVDAQRDQEFTERATYGPYPLATLRKRGAH